MLRGTYARSRYSAAARSAFTWPASLFAGTRWGWAWPQRCFALVAGLVVSTWQAVRATRAESKEKVQRLASKSGLSELRATAEEQARQIGCQLYASQMNMGLKTWQNGDLAGALAVLERYRHSPARPTCGASSGSTSGASATVRYWLCRATPTGCARSPSRRMAAGF